MVPSNPNNGKSMTLQSHILWLFGSLSETTENRYNLVCTEDEPVACLHMYALAELSRRSRHLNPHFRPLGIITA